MPQERLVRQTFAQQAVWCEKLGSLFTARLLAGLGERLDRSSVTGQKVLGWTGRPDALGDAVALRLAGGLHGLVRRGRLPELAKLYPPHPLPGVDGLSLAALEAIVEADEELLDWLQFTPQTNEVARSGVLYPGLMQIAQQTGLPLRLFEVGASAGLNLFPDKFSYQYGGVSLGQQSSSVTLSPEWIGREPDGPAPRIIERRGCDLAPLDVLDPAHCERLVAYVWPDQADRISRVEKAISIAQADPPKLDAADAPGWVDAAFESDAEPGAVRVLFHSIAYQYFPDDAKQRIADRMNAAGQSVSRDAPIAWLAFEQFQSEGPRLTLRLWPDGDERILARADAHGRRITWLSPM